MKNLVFSVIILIILILTFSLTSCEKKSFNSTYNYIYGEWTPTSIDSWYQIDLKSFGNRIQFKEDHSYKIFRNDTLLEQGDINMVGRTDIKLIVKFVPENIFHLQKYSQMNRSVLEVTCFSNDSIRMANNIVDGGYFSIYLSKKK